MATAKKNDILSGVFVDSVVVSCNNTCDMSEIRKAILKVAAFAIFSVLSHNMLENLLKKTLKKSMFRSWFNMYHKYNENF